MTSINKNMLYDMFNSGCNFIEQEYEYINKLNVFPVPDGDTGSNMMSTLKGAIEEVGNLSEYSLYEFAKKFSRSLLMNAHGNSGVILSQIIKGFLEPIDAQSKYIDVNLLLKSFNNAKEIAYKVVDSPKEGTILTIIRVVAEKLNMNKSNYTTIEEIFADVILFAEEALKLTPDLLPVLKKANVVDSGAYGLISIFKGMNNALTISNKQNENIKKLNLEPQVKKVEEFGINSDFITTSEEGYGYCCEFILEIGAILQEDQETVKAEFDPKKLTDELNQIGNSLVFVYDDIFCKVHIHTLTPYKVLQIGQKYGEFHKIKIDNMTLQRNKNKGIDTLMQIEKNNPLETEPILVATVPTLSIANLLKTEFNVQHVINRAKDKNPSVKEFIDLLKRANSKKIVLVVDNKDSFLAANQAAKELREQQDLQILVFECNNIIEAIFAILSFNKYDTLANISKRITKVLKKIISLQITKSVKNINVDSHIHVKKDDFIVISEKKIISANKDLYKEVISAIDYIIAKKKHNWKDTIYIIVNNLVEDEVINKIAEYVKKIGYEAEIIKNNEDKFYFYLGA